jgi:hypothetical protein
MKPRHLLPIVSLLALLPFKNIAQCSGAVIQQRYDTVLRGTGASNELHSITFPQFNPALGTLLDVHVSSVVSMSYDFELENGAATSRSSRVRINRMDEISGNALDVPLTNDFASPSPTTYHGPFVLAASDGVAGSGPDYYVQAPIMLLENDTVINQTFANTADYLGTGSINFDYTSDVSYTMTGGLGVSYFGQGFDTITFALTYNYCATGSLASNITRFTASKSNDDIQLKWVAQNEQHGSKYELQKSDDGKSFTTIYTVPARVNSQGTGSYTYDYRVTSSDNRKILFRIQTNDNTGDEKFSDLRIVDIKPKAAGPKIFPNPSRGNASILFHNTQRANWKVEVFSNSGQLIETKSFNSALLGKLNHQMQLKPGMYFVKATNTSTNESFVEKLIVGR